jgi:hypothetical protein
VASNIHKRQTCLALVLFFGKLPRGRLLIAVIVSLLRCSWPSSCPRSLEQRPQADNPKENTVIFCIINPLVLVQESWNPSVLPRYNREFIDDEAKLMRLLTVWFKRILVWIRSWQNIIFNYENAGKQRKNSRNIIATKQIRISKQDIASWIRWRPCLSVSLEHKE